MILCFVRSHGVSPKPFTSSIGFMVVKKTASLPLLRLVPHGINPFLIIEFNSFADPTWWRYSVNPFGIILQRRIYGNTSRMSLDCSEIRNVSGRVRTQAILKPFLGSSFCEKCCDGLMFKCGYMCLFSRRSLSQCGVVMSECPKVVRTVQDEM